MESAPRFDARLAPLTQHVKSMAAPQKIFAEKAGDVRAEHADGVVTQQSLRVRQRHAPCLGSHLARLGLRIATEELLNPISDFHVSPGEELVYDNVSVRTATYLPISFAAQPV